MRAGIISVVALLLLPETVIADDTRLAPQRVRQGEVAQLTIEADFSFATLPPLDSSPLERDFRVLDIASRLIRMQNEDGDLVHRARWHIQIAPRRAGLLEVPALSFGERSSQVLSLQVEAVTAVEVRHELFIEVIARPETAYVGQEIQLITRVFQSGVVSGSRLTNARAANSASFLHGGDRHYPLERDGRVYRVLERRQSLFPRQSGVLLLDGVEFRGRFGGGAGFADRWLHRRVESRLLEVRDPPASFAGINWLPARRVDLELQWARPPGEIRAGESLEFTLTLVADGLAAEFLPANLLARVTDGLSIFPDKERREDLLEGDRVVGRLSQAYAIVAPRGGEYPFPGLTLDWWDTASDVPRQARLAPFGLSLHGPADARAGSAPTAAGVFWLNPVLIGGGVIIVLMAAGLLILKSRIAAWLARQRPRRELRRACRSGDTATARELLVEWRRSRPPGQLSTELRAAAAELDAALYAPAPVDWRGDRLWRAFSNEAGNAPPAARPSPRLPMLYPETGVDT